MGVASLSRVVVVLEHLAGELVEEASANLHVWKDDGPDLDPPDECTDRGSASHGPSPKDTVLPGWVIDHGSIGQVEKLRCSRRGFPEEFQERHLVADTRQ